MAVPVALPSLVQNSSMQGSSDTDVIFIVVIGGIGTMEGPVIGAIIFYLLQRYLADFGASYLVLLGTLGILIMLFAPKGLWGLVSERYGLTLFLTRRRLIIVRDSDRA